jgi:hypothetical protein
MVEIHILTPLNMIRGKKVYPEIPLTPKIKDQLEKNKDSVMHQEMKNDLLRFIYFLPTYIDKEGIERIKCEISCFMIPVKPKSTGGGKKQIYREYLKDYFKSKSKLLEKFKEFEIIVYIFAYFSKDRYQTNVDNIPQPIINAMKPYFQGDRKVKVLIVEKKMLDENYPKDDLNYLENSMVIVVDAMIRDDILKI